MRSSNVIFDEILGETKSILSDTADVLSESTYSSFSLTTILLPALFKEISRDLATTIPQSPLSGPLWCYLDAFCSAMTGLFQLLDDQNHRSVVTKIKGVANISSSIQLTVLTAVSFSALGAPGFALAFNVGFLLSLDDFLCAMRRKFSINYWMKDKYSELNHLNKNLIPKLQAEIAALAADDKSKMAHWIRKRQCDRRRELLNRKKKIEEDILCRLALRKYDAFFYGANVVEMKNISDFLTNKENAGHIDTNNFLTTLQPIIHAENEETLVSSLKVQGMSSIEDSSIRLMLQKNENRIQAESQKQLNDALINTIIWGTASAGMLLLCFPAPGTQIAGLILVSLASAFYLAKNANRIKNGAVTVGKWAHATFFSPKVADEQHHAEKNVMALCSQHD